MMEATTIKRSTQRRSPAAKASVAVIIPFFQREPGILVRAVRSVIEQEDVEPAQIVVIDDGSPLPAIQELERAGLADDPRIRLLVQPNAGPGAARNTGLDSLDDSIDFVAMLDSDDRWLPQHLRRALRALGSDGEVYFCNHTPVNSARDQFAWIGFDPERHRQIDRDDRLYEFTGSYFDAQFRYVTGTSTVVYRRRPFADLRFDARYRYAGEDCLFLLDLAVRAQHVRFTSFQDAVYGNGVNIWAASQGTLSPNVFRSTYFAIGAAEELKRRYALTEEQRQHLVTWRRYLDKNYGNALVWQLRAQRRIDLRFALLCGLRYPRVLGATATALLSAMRNRLGGRAAKPN